GPGAVTACGSREAPRRPPPLVRLQGGRAAARSPAKHPQRPRLLARPGPRLRLGGPTRLNAVLAVDPLDAPGRRVGRAEGVLPQAPAGALTSSSCHWARWSAVPPDLFGRRWSSGTRATAGDCQAAFGQRPSFADGQVPLEPRDHLLLHLRQIL